MKIITANTFTPLYDATEDRIRLVINYQDIQNRVDLMITRAFMINLIPSAEEYIAQYYAKEPLAQERATSHATQESANPLSQTDNTNLELLRMQEELLSQVKFTFQPKTKQTVVTFQSKNIVAVAKLNASLLTQVFEILKSTIPFYQWGISPKF